MQQTDMNANFHRDGFAIAENLADQTTLKDLQAAYERMLSGATQCPTTDRKLGGLTRQIIMPHLYEPVFADNQAVDKARNIAAKIQGWGQPEFVYSMLIYKPAGHQHETPWHQDISYTAEPTAPTGMQVPNEYVLTFWLALDDVTEDMGCMEFIPGVQRQPMYEHHVCSGDPHSSERLTAIVEPGTKLNLNTRIAAPVAAGNATIHGYHTPHFTGANRSERPRRAFIFSFNHPETVTAVAKGLGLQ